jgi:DNA-binding response OmpR family regulator
MQTPLAPVKILVVDDEQPVRFLLTEHLTRAGYDVVTAADGQEGLQMFERHSPTLVLLDVMMPKMSGWAVLEALRERSDVPVLMLTARSAEVDQLAGFGLGADDYVTKPFSIRQLVARVQAILRRSGRANNKIVAGPILVDLGAHDVRVDDQLVALTKREFALLEELARNPGRAYTRTELLARCWEPGYTGVDRVVDVHMASLRRKMGKRRNLISTVRGVGYRLNLE